MSFPRYPRYKDSGVECLGEVPEHWEVKRLKNVLQCRITDGPHTTPIFIEEGIPFLSVDGIQDGELIFEGCRYISKSDHEEYRKKANPQKNDILLGKAASIGKIARVKVDFEFSIWSPLALIRLSWEVANPVFFEYSLKALHSQAQIDIFCTANTQKNISMDDIPKIALSSPPLPEQTHIATFLDRETGKIDALVAEQQKLIELLKEKRQALISRTVTKGLPAEAAREFGLLPHTRFKDSGIEWLGEVPEGWEVIKLHRIAEDIQTGPFGSQLHSDDYVEGGIPLVNPAHILSGEVVPEERSSVDEETAIRLAQHRLREGDIIMGRRGEIGRCAVIGKKEEGWVCGTGSLVVRLRIDSAYFFFYVVASNGFSSLLTLHAVGTTMLNINPSIVGQLLIPLPPLPEQTLIAEFLDRETAKIDDLVTQAERGIELLQERRSALISAAVTGQIDVREYA